MKKSTISRLTTIALLIIASINTIVLVRIWILTNTSEILRENSASYVLPSGFAPNTIKPLWDESLSSTSGWIVRYVSKECIYCSLDFEWERLAVLLEDLNYRTMLLLPKETEKLDEDKVFPKTAQQIAFVKMDWIKQFNFIGTPTVIIFDNNGRVLWHRKGMLSEDDFESAKNAVLTSKKR